jgi:hypothetical protein
MARLHVSNTPHAWNTSPAVSYNDSQGLPKFYCEYFLIQHHRHSKALGFSPCLPEAYLASPNLKTSSTLLVNSSSSNVEITNIRRSSHLPFPPLTAPLVTTLPFLSHHSYPPPTTPFHDTTPTRCSRARCPARPPT